MKLFLTFITIIIFSFPVQAQKAGCIKFRNGKFKTTLSDGKIAIIIREGLHQSEYTLTGRDTLKVDFIVKWMDDCTYTLTPNAETQKTHSNITKNVIITVKMSDLKVNSYVQTSSSNFSDKIFTSEMVLLPNK